MFTHTLFCTLICIFFATHAADDKIITIQGNDGASITFPASVAKHSVTLNNILADCPINQVIPITNFNTQELISLANVLNTINASPLQDDAIRSLRNTFTPDVFELTPTFLNLCRLDNFFDVPVLQKMLLHYIAYTANLPKDWALRDRETIALVCEKLQEASDCDDLCRNDRVGLGHLIDIIKDEQLADKKQFLQSKGKIKGPFFMGVSVGELVAHGIIDTRYKSIIGIYSNIPFVQARVEYLEDVPISIEGLICNAPAIPDIKQKKKELFICDTGISYLPANSFQRVHSPEELFVIYNKLVNIHPEAFAGLHTLTRLKIDNGSNDIFTHMPVGTLDPLRNLVRLSLGDTSFNPLLLKYCSKLKCLLLCRNHLAELPARWPQACTTLEKITIIKNDFRCIPLSFLDHFPLLQELSLPNNKIKHIHADTFKSYKNLIYLNLAHNPIPQKEITALRAALPHIEIEF